MLHNLPVRNLRIFVSWLRPDLASAESDVRSMLCSGLLKRSLLLLWHCSTHVTMTADQYRGFARTSYEQMSKHVHNLQGRDLYVPEADGTSHYCMVRDGTLWYD